VKYSVVILQISALVALAAVSCVEQSYSQTPSRPAYINQIVRAAEGCAPNFGPALAITIMTIVGALVAYFWKQRA
jgi:hypothetical protein